LHAIEKLLMFLPPLIFHKLSYGLINKNLRRILLSRLARLLSFRLLGANHLLQRAVRQLIQVIYIIALLLQFQSLLLG